MKIQGTFPWFSVEAGASELVITAHLPFPASRDVNRCMNCPYQECINCMSGGRSDGQMRREKSGRPPCEAERIARMLAEGRTNREIREAVGCCDRTVRRYKRKIAVSI